MKQICANALRTMIRKLVRWSAPIISGELENYQLNQLRQRLCAEQKELFIQWPVTITGDVRIGDRVSMAAYVHIWGEGGVEIGNDVMIGSHTALISNTHDPQSVKMWKTEVIAPVKIEDNVWIGAHSLIMPGVTIHEGCVIGAGSVVTKDIPANHIAYGVPAQLIRERIKMDCAQIC